MKKRHCLFSLGCFCAVFSVVALSGACSEKKAPQPGRMVGGPCHYKTYPGMAEVISVEKIKDSNEGENKDAYDVRFLFKSHASPKAPFARIEGKPQRFLLANGSAPKGGFLKKYDIAVGKELPCDLEVIVKGTCTPIIFKFPTVDLTDYAANR